MPTPVRILFAGQTDASGAAQIPVKAPPTMYAVLSVVGQATGNPNWTVQAAGQLLTFGNGPQVSLGPLLTTPGENLVITLSGATPSAQVTGTLAGNQYLTAEEAAANYQPMPNAISLNTFQGRQRLYPDGSPPASATAPSFAVASGLLSGAIVFTLPVGTVAIRLLVTAGGLLFTYQLLVLGRQSVEQYFGNTGAPGSSVLVPTPTLPITIPIENDWDRQVEIHVELPTQNVNVFVSALFAPEPPGQAGASQSVFEPTPAPWQAANLPPFPVNLTLAAGASTVVVNAVAGQSVYLFALNRTYDAVVVTEFALQDTSGTNYHIEQVSSVNPGPALWSAARLPTGLGAQIKNLGANAATMRGSLVASQA